MTCVSIVIAAFKAGATLPKAVASALSQEGVAVEVIIIDDASPDDTAAVARSLANSDPRVQVITLSTNGGPSVARNAGFAAATGDWVAVLDADDTMAPDRLAKLTTFAAEKNADAVYDNLALVRADEPASEAEPFLPSESYGQQSEWDLGYFVARNQARPGHPSLGYLKPVINRRFLAQHNLKYRSALRNGEDFHLMLDALVAGAKLWFYPDPLYH